MLISREKNANMISSNVWNEQREKKRDLLFGLFLECFSAVSFCFAFFLLLLLLLCSRWISFHIVYTSIYIAWQCLSMLLMYKQEWLKEIDFWLTMKNVGGALITCANKSGLDSGHIYLEYFATIGNAFVVNARLIHAQRDTIEYND